MTGLAWGETLKQIADSIVGECEMLMENMDDMSMEELEEEYYCEFEDYKKLAECDNPTFEMIANFSFQFTDIVCFILCHIKNKGRGNKGTALKIKALEITVKL